VSCPDVDAIQSVVEGAGMSADRAAVVAHAETCDACRALLGELVRGSPREPELATQARAAYGEPRSAAERAEVDAWLARHRSAR